MSPPSATPLESAFEIHPEAAQIVEKFIGERQQRSFEKDIAQGRAVDVVAVLEARGLAVTDAERERILGCTDLERLARWVRRAATIAATEALLE